MKAIDKLYTKYPFYGARRLSVNLPVEFQPVNIKRVGRLMKLMGIEAIYPKPNLSTPDLQHKIYRCGEPSVFVKGNKNRACQSGLVN